METTLTADWCQSQAQALDSAAHDCDGLDAHAARSHREAAQAWRLAARALRLESWLTRQRYIDRRALRATDDVTMGRSYYARILAYSNALSILRGEATP